jgi:hypothetical protein
VRKRCDVVAGLIFFAVSISSFAQPVFFSVEATPYDRQMRRVSPTLNSGTGGTQVPMSLDVVNQWMTELRAMPYRFSPYWQTPGEVNLMQAADCKGKAVALYAQMRRYGAHNVRVVIGKRHPYDANTHAWLEWETNQGNYTLDPTFHETAMRTADLDPMMYVATYAYDGDHKYRASRAGYFAPSTRVAAGSSDRVYVPPSIATTNYAQAGFTPFGAPQFYPPTTQYQRFAQQRVAAGRSSWSQTQSLSTSIGRTASTQLASNSASTYQRSTVATTTHYGTLAAQQRPITASTSWSQSPQYPAALSRPITPTVVSTAQHQAPVYQPTNWMPTTTHQPVTQIKVASNVRHPVTRPSMQVRAASAPLRPVGVQTPSWTQTPKTSATIARPATPTATTTVRKQSPNYQQQIAIARTAPRPAPQVEIISAKTVSTSAKSTAPGIKQRRVRRVVQQHHKRSTRPTRLASQS